MPHSEHPSGETRTALLEQAMLSLASTMMQINSKLDTMSTQLVDGIGKFKDLEHNDKVLDMRIAALEAAKAQSSSTKQTIAMMLLDKGVGILLPWGAIAYILWGKTQ